MSKRILFIGGVWPEPRSSAAGTRSLSWLRAFRDEGWETHFASPASDEGQTRELQPVGTHAHPISPNDPAFDAWIARLQPDIVLFERFMIEEQFGWRVRRHCPQAALVLDTVDLHFLRRARQESVLRGAALELGSELALREIASIYRCDLTLVISETELALLTDADGPFRVPRALLLSLGFCYDPPPPAPPESERSGFAVIGNFRHEPNSDGVRWLKHELWPRVRARLPQAQVEVYGAYPPREIMRLNDAASGFRVRGPAREAHEALSRARVNLAPLRFGAGLKGKIADGWWAGTPCVTTSVGAEGMKLEGRFGGLIADEPESFAAAAHLLHEDAPLRAQARGTGYEILRARFDHGRNAALLLEEVHKLRMELSARRAANFTGRMLGHHLARSTEYFSRWIEIKNRTAAGRAESALDL